MKKISFLTFGSCITRDIFRLFPNKNFVVNTHIQSINPVSFVSKPVGDLLFKENLNSYNWPNFDKRNLFMDFNKTSFDWFKEHRADYLILDLCEARFSLY